MIRNLLILPDGQEVFSGVPGAAAVREVTLTQRTGDEGDLMPGAVCAAQAEITLYHTQGLDLTRFTLFHVYSDGTRKQVGLFQGGKPERTGPNVCRVMAYDNVRLLDRDLSAWLASLTGWPYTLQELAGMVCAQCGLTLAESELPNGAFLVSAFGGEGITGRQVMAWIGQLTGRFCRARPDGTLEFAWYTPSGITVGPTGEHYYFQNSLRLADYTVAPVEKVRLQKTREDVGTVWPDTEQALNTLTVTGNYLLGTSIDARQELAQTLYEQFAPITYTPGTLTVPAELPIDAGQILTVSGHTLYIMSRVQTGQRAELRCTGEPDRSATAMTNSVYKTFTGRILELEMDLDGLRAEHKNDAGQQASLRLELEGITAQVTRQQTQADALAQSMTALQQTADGVSIQVEKLLREGTDKLTTAMGYTFDDTGLHIRRDGAEVATVIDETGMEVSRGSTNVLRANADGVKAIDVTVENYLRIGNHARLEDYGPSRTACFYVE